MPTAELRQLVRALRAEGLPLRLIAPRLRITIPTLLLNYPAELESKSQTGARRARRDHTKGQTNGH